MKTRKIDQLGARAGHMSGIPNCLQIPIAARDMDSVETYVGDIVGQLAPRGKFKALLRRTQGTGIIKRNN